MDIVNTYYQNSFHNGVYLFFSNTNPLKIVPCPFLWEQLVPPRSPCWILGHCIKALGLTVILRRSSEKANYKQSNNIQCRCIIVFLYQNNQSFIYDFLISSIWKQEPFFGAFVDKISVNVSMVVINCVSFIPMEKWKFDIQYLQHSQICTTVIHTSLLQTL